MCGIVGIVKLNPRETVAEACLKRMRDVLGQSAGLWRSGAPHPGVRHGGALGGSLGGRSRADPGLSLPRLRSAPTSAGLDLLDRKGLPLRIVTLLLPVEDISAPPPGVSILLEGGSMPVGLAFEETREQISFGDGYVSPHHSAPGYL